MVLYREATLADLPAIRALGREVNALHHEAWPEVFAASPDPWREEALWRAAIGGADATTFVAETEGGVVGFANVQFVSTETNPLVQPVAHARIGSVGVAAAHRRRGIGRELMRRVEEWAAARGAHRIALNVWAFNGRAIQLYEALGYEVRAQSMGKRLVPAVRETPPTSGAGAGLHLQVDRATEQDAPEAAGLVHASFNALAAGAWSPVARERFLAESSAQRLGTAIREAAYAALARLKGAPAGFVLMPTPRVLGMLFVHPDHLRRGVARSLWEAARAQVETDHPDVTTVELNATPYAVPAYLALGFVAISRSFERDGCVATRMACWLPARRLDASP